MRDNKKILLAWSLSMYTKIIVTIFSDNKKKDEKWTEKKILEKNEN